MFLLGGELQRLTFSSGTDGMEDEHSEQSRRGFFRFDNVGRMLGRRFTGCVENPTVIGKMLDIMDIAVYLLALKRHKKVLDARFELAPTYFGAKADIIVTLPPQQSRNCTFSDSILFPIHFKVACKDVGKRPTSCYA